MLRNRDFLFLWVVNIAATLAIELFGVTILVTIFQETASTLQAAGTMVARSLPAFLLGPVAGVSESELHRSLQEAPLHLVEQVVLEDRPYSEVVTALQMITEKRTGTLNSRTAPS